MTVDAWVWILAVILAVGLLFTMLFFLLAFDELKNDHKNPVDVCNNLNPFVLPEYCVHGFLTLMFLGSGHWTSFLVNLPLLVYHVMRYARRPQMRAQGIYDPTDVFNRGELTKSFNECGIKLTFYMLCFFWYLYRMMFELLASEKVKESSSW
eukprot:m.15988 g.15988  ORF g.15988 m.15988 type:complete len:152 (-) comp5130_c1_seq1:43-498(-)